MTDKLIDGIVVNEKFWDGKVHNGYPIVRIISVTSGNVVVLCPYCGKNHTHGGGKGWGGNRVSHCGFFDTFHTGEYYLDEEGYEKQLAENKP